PTATWGDPKDSSARDKWPSYHNKIWTNPAASDADLYLVDGRFRVACFMQIVLNCEPDALIVFHDFAGRKNYHVVREVAREIAIGEELSVFQPRKGKIRKRAQ